MPDRRGAAHVTVGDHLGHFAPLTACAILAEATSRVRRGPLVPNNDLRHPVVLAHEAVALADQAEGRRWTIFADRPGHQPAETLVLELLAAG